MPSPLQLIRKLHDQNSVLRNESDQRHESDLRIDVERRRPVIGEKCAERHLQEREEQRAEHRQRHRAEKNDERIAEAVELRGQDQKDQDNRERKDGAELAAFNAQLTRFAGVIDDVTFRQNFVRLRPRETLTLRRATESGRR